MSLNNYNVRQNSALLFKLNTTQHNTPTKRNIKVKFFTCISIFQSVSNYVYVYDLPMLYLNTGNIDHKHFSKSQLQQNLFELNHPTYWGRKSALNQKV